MRTLSIVKLSFSALLMAVLVGCSANPEKEANYSKPKQPILGKTPPSDYKESIKNPNPQITVIGNHIRPSPVAISGGSITLDVVVNELVAKDQAELNLDNIKSISAGMLAKKGVNVVKENADYDVKLLIAGHGKRSVVKHQMSSADVGNLTSMIGSTGAFNAMGTNDFIGLGVALTVLQKMSGGESERNVTVMRMSVKNNKTNDVWENVFEHYNGAFEKIDQAMITNVIREQLEPLDKDYVAELSR